MLLANVVLFFTFLYPIFSFLTFLILRLLAKRTDLDQICLINCQQNNRNHFQNLCFVVFQFLRQLYVGTWDMSHLHSLRHVVDINKERQWSENRSLWYIAYLSVIGQLALYSEKNIRSQRYARNHRIHWSKKPIASNFFNKILWFIVLKALCRSIKVIPVRKHSRKPFRILSVKKDTQISRVICSESNC